MPELHLSFHSRLGHGAFGVVYSATHTRKNIACAVKIQHRSCDLPDTLDSEAACHAIVTGGPSIVALSGLADIGAYIILTLELCSGGTLRDFLAKGRYWMNTSLTMSHFMQLLDAVEFCHQKGVYHCDIKPRSVL